MVLGVVLMMWRETHEYSCIDFESSLSLTKARN
jgi:hypothetical protein